MYAIRSYYEEPTVFRFSYDLAYIHDDNVRLARDDVDIREDNILSATRNNFV